MTDPAGAPPRTVLHVDMNAFYAAVEVLLDPSLAGKPVIVGGTGARGVVASCSYEARAYGVRSAMPSVRARRLCPHAVFLPGRFDAYNEHSKRIHAVFAEFTPLVEGIALDEAFLDLTGGRRLFGDGGTAGVAVRQRILDAVGLSCSVGVAPSKLLAKLASEEAKPPTPARPGEPPAPPRPPSPGARIVAEGVVAIDPGQELAFLHPLPVRALWGVGPATFQRLSRYGVATVGDLARLPEATVVAALGPSLGRHLHELAWARDERPVTPDRPLKSIGHEETFATDHHATTTLVTELVRMADAVASRTRAAGVAGRTVQLKLRFADFRTVTRSRTLPDPVDTAPVVLDTARALLEEPELAALVEERGVRLLGVSLANLVEPVGEQLALFGGAAAPVPAAPATASPSPTAVATTSPSTPRLPTRPNTERTLAAAMDAIRDKFGDKAVGPAVLAGKDGLRVKRRGDTQWGPSAPSETPADTPPGATS